MRILAFMALGGTTANLVMMLMGDAESTIPMAMWLVVLSVAVVWIAFKLERRGL